MMLGVLPLRARGLPRIPRRGLVAEYKMIDASGTTLPDSSGNAYDGTLVGLPTLNALTGDTFDGLTQYVTLPSGAIISNLSASTVLMVASGATQVNRYLYSEGDSGSVNTQSAWGSGSAGGNVTHYLVKDTAGTTEVNSSAARTCMDSTPHIIGLTERYTSGTTSAPRPYLDGTIDPWAAGATTEYARTTKTINRATLAGLGRSTYGSLWAGTLYYVLIYNRHLHSAEIGAITRRLRGILRQRGVL